MADYSALKATIDASINTNGQQAITGAILNDVLNEMVDVLGEGYTFLGVATISTNPTTPEGKAYYLAGAAGTYSNFGNIVVTSDEVALLVWNGTAWSKVVSPAASKEEVSQLGQKVDEIGDKTPITMESGYYYIVGAVVGQTFTGSPQSSSSYTRSKMACSEGDTFLLNIVSGSGAGAVAFTDSDNILLSKVGGEISYNNELVVAPANAAYIYINDKSGNVSYKLGKLGSLEFLVNALANSVNALAPISPEDCDFFNTNFFNPEDSDIVIGKYLSNTSGAMSGNANFMVTGYIPFPKNVTQLQASVNGVYGQGGGFWVLYDENKSPINVGNQMNSTLGVATKTDAAKYVRFSIQNYKAGNIKVEAGAAVTPYVRYGHPIIKDSVIPENIGYYSTVSLASFADGQSIIATRNRVKFNKHLVFSAKISEMGTLLVGHGQSGYGASWLEITSTNIISHNYLVSDTTETKAHGLTLANTIQVIIEQDVDETCSVKLVSNGNTYATTFVWRGTVGDVFAKSVGGTFTDAILSWTADGLTEDIWGFGDSYFGFTTDQRWVYYLVNDGHTKWLANAQAGGNSAGAEDDLRKLIVLAHPKKILWAMGMNDPDTSSAVNTSWNTCYESVKSICEKFNIELILATIPSVSGDGGGMRIHKYKNAIVRNSGYRYIDFDKAVGADEATGQWYTGMLSVDGVHPTASGAVTLYMQAVSNFPELMTT